MPNYKAGNYEVVKQLVTKKYHNYLNNSENKKLALQELLELFKISIRADNLEDYYIEDINLEKLSVKIIDLKTGLLYSSYYIFDNNLEENKYLIKTIIQDEHYKFEDIFSNEHDKPIKKLMIYIDETNNTVFEKNVLDNNNIIIKISKTSNHKEYHILDSFSQKNPSSTKENPLKENIKTKEKNVHLVNDSIIYSFSDFSKKETCNYIKGVFLEKIPPNVRTYLPSGISPKKFDMLKDDSVVSTIIFEVCINNKKTTIEIYKIDSFIEIRYKSDYLYPDSAKKAKINTWILPVDNNDSISINELILINNKLKSSLANNIFLNTISEEILFFAKQISSRNSNNNKKETKVDFKSNSQTSHSKKRTLLLKR